MSRAWAVAAAAVIAAAACSGSGGQTAVDVVDVLDRVDMVDGADRVDMVDGVDRVDGPDVVDAGEAGDRGGEGVDAVDVVDAGEGEPGEGVDAVDVVDAVEAGDVPALGDGEGDVPPALWDLWPVGTLEKECLGGFLVSIDSPSGPVRMLVVRGSHYDMGLQAGCLAGPLVGQFYASFWAYFTEELISEAGEMGFTPEQTTALLSSMLSNLWGHMLPFVPQKYLEELQGFEDAVLSDPQTAALFTESTPAEAMEHLLLLSNLSDLNWDGDFEEVLEKLTTGYSQMLKDYYALALRTLVRVAAGPGPFPALPFRTSCSFFAAWGPRTEGGRLFGSRNLDWSTDTGIAQLKGLTLYAPESELAHVAIGYLGFPGALAGLNERGVALSEVGSTSALERLKGEPWTLRFREVLESASDLETAVAIASGVAVDQLPRPTTIGYNWMVAFGDPPDGAAAGAAALETNGLLAGIYLQGPECDAVPTLVEFDAGGTAVSLVTHEEDPWRVNLEGEAVEVDANGEPRLFQVDGEGEFVLDALGMPLPAAEGKPYPVGKPLGCAVFRGDEALMHGVRMWQLAANGPQDGDELLVASGSYRNRYLVMHDMLAAYESGAAYEHGGKTWIEATGASTLVGAAQAETIARAAALSSNVMSIVYDATALRIRVSYETGTGETWEAASLHDYLEVDLAPMFALATLAQALQEEE